MTNETAAPWSSDRLLTLDQVAEILREQFPELADRPLRSLAAGWDSEAFEVDERWIFRFPKRQNVVEHLETELSVLPLLAPQLPLPVPSPRFHGEASERFPYPFMGYAKLPGAPLDEVPARALRIDAVLDALVAFLEVLHATPLEGAVAQVRGWPVGEDLEARILRLGLSEEPLIASALRRLQREISPPPAPRLVHDDLGMEHVLIDPQGSEVTGIIDWGDMNLGDPAHDFVGLLAWVGDAPLRRALDRSTYPADPALLGRARHGLIRGHLHGWCDGVEHDAQEMRSGARRALGELVGP
ncbi:MAG: phosphotransferase [Acidobacteriota bacterium]